MSFKRTLFAILFLILAVFLARHFGPQKRTCSFYSMGGILTEIQGYHTNQTTFNRSCKKIIDFFEEMENEISTYRSGSFISRLNGRNDKTIVVFPERTFYLVKESLRLSQKTNGYFDITVLPLVDLWQKSEKKNKVPPKAEIMEELRKVSYKKIKINNDVQFEIFFDNPSMKLDFGAIGKGYMGDIAAQIMRKEGIPRGLVNCGGGIVAFDLRKSPEPFRIQIYNPDNTSTGSSIIALLNESVQTSGDYNRYLTIEGKKFSHIIDPHTGYPGGTCHSITVKAKTGIIADGYSTGFCSMVAAGIDPASMMAEDAEILQLKKN